MNQSQEKNPLTCPEVEDALLGALMLCGAGKVSDLIQPEDFFGETSRVVAGAIWSLDNSGAEPDPVAVFDAIPGRTVDLGHLCDLYKNTGSASNARHLASIVAEKSRRRKTLSAALKLCAAAKGEQSLDAALHDFQGAIDSTSKTAGARSLRDVLVDVVGELEIRTKNGGGIVGTRTGFDGIDERLGGMRGGDLIICAARPGMGKTALALNIATASAQQGSVFIVSAEMQAAQLGERIVSASSRVQFRNIRTGMLSGQEYNEITAAFGELRTLPVFIDDSPGLSVAQVRARAKAIAARKPLSLIVVDYIQLLTGEGENRTQQVGDISRGLKRIAKELNCPVLALAQLNRSVESRDNKRPNSSDLRDSGEIEQDADAIMMLYRDSYYRENSPFGAICEVIFTKCRAAETGTVPIIWRGGMMRFEDCDRTEFDEIRNARQKPAGNTNVTGFKRKSGGSNA